MQYAYSGGILCSSEIGTYRSRYLACNICRLKAVAEMMSRKAHYAGSECPPLEKGVLRLYSMRLCPYAQRTRIVLEHKKIPHEVVNIALSKWKPEWYFTKNPFGLVPCLEQDDKLIYESIICNEYLDEVYPDTKLTPSDPYQKAKDRMLLEKWSKVTSAYYAARRLDCDDKQVSADLHKNLQVIEKELADRGTPFFGGQDPMMIDLCLWPHMERILLLKTSRSPDFAVEADRYPQLTAWIGRTSVIPGVQATVLPPEIHLKHWVALAEGNPNYDIGLNESK